MTFDCLLEDEKTDFHFETEKNRRSGNQVSNTAILNATKNMNVHIERIDDTFQPPRKQGTATSR